MSGESRPKTDDELRAMFAAALHALPFDRDEWLVKIDKLYTRLLGLSLAKTGLADHPAYVAVHKALLEYWKLRYREYNAPATGFALLVRAVKASKEAVAVGKAFESMALVDAEFVAGIRLLMMADIDGAIARRRAR